VHVKRLLDIALSALGLIFLVPVFLLVAVLIRLDSAGPVFFRQERMGRGFVPFRIYKFRTMVRDASQRGEEITAGGDERVTRVGRLLRKCKVDELPQLLNVLKGEMSLVGPRPEVKTYVDMYESDYREILKVRPGITDISSIVFRDEERVLMRQSDPGRYYREVLLPQKIELARRYIQRASFFYDLKIVAMTIYRLFRYVEPLQGVSGPGAVEGSVREGKK
jgi:lipopolysaccharide/colanic/teichoic acid biosynthesis glycosyltransferase